MATYTDLNLSLKKHPSTHDVLKKVDVEAVKGSLKNLLFGQPFDVPFNPHYGSSFKRLLFELISPTTIATTRREILLKIDEYEPRCVVEGLEISSTDNEVNVELSFYVTGNKQIQHINFVLERIR